MLFINLEPIFIFFKWTLDATIFQATSLRRSSVCRFLYRFLFQIKSLSVSLPSCVVSRRWNDLRCRRLCVLAVVDFGGVFRVFRASFRAIGRSWRHRRRRRLLFLFVVPYFVGWKEMETIFFSYLSLFVPLSFGISDVRVFSSLSTEFPPYFTGFYWVLLGFTGFYWAFLSFTSPQTPPPSPPFSSWSFRISVVEKKLKPLFKKIKAFSSYIVWLEWCAFVSFYRVLSNRVVLLITKEKLNFVFIRFLINLFSTWIFSGCCLFSSEMIFNWDEECWLTGTWVDAGRSKLHPGTCFSRHHLVLPNFTGFLPDFTEFYRVSPSLQGCYLTWDLFLFVLNRFAYKVILFDTNLGV